MARPSPRSTCAVVCLVGATLVAHAAHALIVITICNEPGNFAHCALPPAATHPEHRTLEYVPVAATANQFTEEGLLTSGWIGVPQAPSLLLVAQGDSEIRSIRGTSGVPTLFPNLFPNVGSVSAEADGVALGTFGPGETIDFEVLRGGGATSVMLTLGRVDPEFSLASWLVAMRGFEPVSDPLARSPAHVLVSLPVPEPSAGPLLAVGLAVFAAATRSRGRHSRA